MKKRIGTTNNSNRLLRDTRGLTTIEYVVILAVIAIFGIGTWSVFSGKVKTNVEKQGDTLQNL